MNHSDSCKAQNLQHTKLVNCFERQHPSYCRECGGWGFITTPGCSVPYGSTEVSLPDDVDPCPSCLEEGLCPHCGKPVSSHDDTLEDAYCQNCGWVDGCSEGLPEPYECLCWME